VGVLVEILNKIFHISVILPGIVESKVATPRECKNVSSASWHHFGVDVIYEFDHLVFGIETFECWVTLECIIIVDLKVRNPTVMILEK